MDWFVDFITNPFLLTSTSSWFVAQVLKTIINGVVNKQWTLERMVGDGGMPSGHSATVSSLATIIAMRLGPGSVEFAIAGILAIIVCHDAMGVRRETGKQAVLLNEIIHSFEFLTKKELPEVKLKEFVGHTPSQVIVGIVIGIINALIMHFVVF